MRLPPVAHRLPAHRREVLEMQIPFLASRRVNVAPRTKKAILTYHRVLDEDAYEAANRARGRHFYDMPAERFRRQIEKVAAQASAHAGGAPLPCVELAFDDGTQDHLSVAEMLAKLDLSGIFFIITGRIGEPGYLSQADLRILIELGQRI